MSIIDGFVDWAIRRDHILPHPGWRTYPDENTGAGVTWHSAVTDSRLSVEGEMLNPVRQFSVMFILEKDGTLYQYYPIKASPWCSGSQTANTTTWCLEAIGGRSPIDEPLTDAQVETCVRLIGEYEESTGNKASRGSDAHFGDDRTMFEHNDWVSTACPSGRYDRLWRILAEEDDVDEARVREIIDEVLHAELLKGEGIPTLARLNEAEVARWSGVHTAQDLLLRYVEQLELASDPDKVPD